MLHVITGLETGGAEMSLCRLVESRCLPALEHTVVALGREGPLSDRIRRAGVQLVHLDVAPMRPSPLPFMRLRKLVTVLRPVVMHGWMYHGNLASTLAARGLEVPVIWGVRQTLYKLRHEKPLTRLVIRADRRLSGCPVAILYNSATSARQHEAFGYPPDKTWVIPNGFDTTQFRPDIDAGSRVRTELGIPDDAVAIGLVARVHPMKDHANFFRAARILLKQHDGVFFVLVGDGTEADDLSGRIAAAGLSERVRACGPRTDMAAVYAAFDIGSSSSAWGEAFPNAIGEAMACGVPCVATDVGDVREIIGNTGTVVPPRDSHALAAGWKILIDGGLALRAAQGAAARRRIVERFSLAEVSGRYMSLYQKMARDG